MSRRAFVRGWAAAAVVAAWACAGCEQPKVGGARIAAEPPTTRPASASRKLEDLARTDHIALLEQCLRHYEGRYHDYTGTLIKQERIDGKLGTEQWVRFKFLDAPFSVVMAWTRNPGPGDRMLYVQGKYDGNMLVRPTGGVARFLAGDTVVRKPDSKDAMKNSLRRVDQFGFNRSLTSLLEAYRLGKSRGVLKQEFGGYARLDGRDTLVLVRYLPDSPEYPAYKTLTYIDLGYLLPVCVEAFDPAGALTCRYVNQDLKFNVGLTPKDFLPEANGLKTPRK